MRKKKSWFIRCPACDGAGTRVLVSFNVCETIQCAFCNGKGIIDESDLDESVSKFSLSKKCTGNIYI